MSTKLDSEALTKILLMQNMMGHLPDETSIFEFVCRGVYYLPGVSEAQFARVGEEPPVFSVGHIEEYPVAIQAVRFGKIFLSLTDPEAFAPYEPYIGNLCFMMAAVMEQRQRRTSEKERQEELERRVTERTKQLANQVVETQAAVYQTFQEKERAQRYLEISEAIIVELNHQGNIAVINQRGAGLLGWKPSELVGKNWFEVAVPAEYREQVRSVFQRGVHGEMAAVEYHENEILCRDGSRRFISWHNVPDVDSEGNLIRMLSSGIDTTERKMTAVALEAEKERLDVTLRSIADGVISVNNEGKIQLLNRAAEFFTGWKRAQAVGKPVDQVYNATPIEKTEDNSSAFEEHGASQRKLISRDGQELLVSHLRTPIYDRNSRQIGSVLVFRDITREYGLRARMERAAKLDSIGVLAGGIAHDFNNLLGGIFGFMELATTSDDMKDVRLYLEKSNSVFERARHLTGQLLTFAKGGAPVLRVGNVGDVVRDATVFALSGSNIGCVYDFEENLYPVQFDEHQIAQVVDNIVINAKQAMYQAGNLHVSAKNISIGRGEHPELEAGIYVKVSIQDAGVGIPPSLLNRIFDPFLTTKQDGSGLGLSTSHSIVQKHGGVIDVESQMDKGSTFHIVLPACRGKSEDLKNEVSSVHHGEGLVILLDDEESIREICSTMLRAMGYGVVCFKNGAEVLNYLKNPVSDLSSLVAALFDLTIPGGLGGAEIVAEVRQQLGEKPAIIAISGYSAGDVMANPKEFGFTNSLPKPFRKMDLAALLEKYT